MSVGKEKPSQGGEYEVMTYAGNPPVVVVKFSLPERDWRILEHSNLWKSIARWLREFPESKRRQDK